MLKLVINQEIFLKKLGAAIFILFLLSAGPSYAVDTSIFYHGGVLSLEQPQVNITKIYGIRLKPLNITENSSDKDIYFSHSVENLSNTTNVVEIDMPFVSREKGWTAELIKDDNGDGSHQWWENTKVDGQIRMGEGAVFNFFVKLTKPDDAEVGSSGSAVVKASSTIKDGDSYMGYNGVTYGGPDEMESTDTVMVK